MRWSVPRRLAPTGRRVAPPCSLCLAAAARCLGLRRSGLHTGRVRRIACLLRRWLTRARPSTHCRLLRPLLPRPPAASTHISSSSPARCHGATSVAPTAMDACEACCAPAPAPSRAGTRAAELRACGACEVAGTRRPALFCLAPGRCVEPLWACMFCTFIQIPISQRPDSLRLHA